MRRTTRSKTAKLWRQFILPLIFIIALACSTVSVSAADDDVIWGSQMGNEFNNPVTDRPAMTEDDAFLKWGTSFGTNGNGMEFSKMPNPPLIIGNYLYTQVDRNILKINKKTGEIAAQSEDLPAKSDWSLHSMVYGNGKLFVTLSNGRVCAVRISDLKVLWTSRLIAGQQMDCPITYREIGGTGYVYTGSWGRENKDGSYTCFREDGNGEAVWSFTPSEDDPGLKDSDYAYAKRGFYWAGAYVTDKYIAFGSDDGAGEGFFDQAREGHAAFYTLDPVTGQIIDQINTICGDLRSTPVYYEENLYVTTKGGVIYQIPVDADGHLGAESHYDFNANASAGSNMRMMTGTPAIVNDRLYIGVSSGGEQFSQKGQKLAVVDVSGNLSQSSLIYEATTPGYPQAAPLASTSEAGKTYVYFTYNYPPGGIYYIVDTPSCKTGPESAGDLFLPEVNMAQYCTCTLAMDLDGTIYYKNDSTTLMAVARNPARVDNIEVTADDGEVDWEPEFRSGIGNYNCTVSTDAKRANVKLTLPSGVSAKVNGIPYTSSGVPVTLSGDQTAIEVSSSCVSDGETYTRVYHLNLIKQDGNSMLSDLMIVNGNNTFNLNHSGKVPTTQSYDESTNTYDVYSEFIEKIKMSSNYINLWLQPASKTSTVRVEPAENCLEKNMSDGAFVPQGSSGDYSRYPIYPKDTRRNTSVNVVVTSQNGKSVTTYHVTLVLHVAVTGITLDQQELSLEPDKTASLKATVEPKNATVQTIAFSSSDPTVAQVNWETGEITALSPGTATITAVTEEGGYAASCQLTVPGDPVTDPAVLADFVERAIAALPDVKDIRAIHAGSIAAAEDAYNKLSEEAKALVKNYDVLQAAQGALDLKDYKETLLTTLQSSVIYSLYYEPEQKILDQILTDATEAIESASTKDVIDTVYQDARNAIDQVPTKEQVDANNEAAKAAFQKSKVTGVKTVKNTMKKLRVTWTPVKDASYYQVEWMLNESGRWYKKEIEAEEGAAYQITGLSEGSCVKVSVRAARIINGEDVFCKWTTPVKVLMHKGTLKKVAKKKKAFTAVWKPLKRATGYQIRYSLKKNFKKSKTKTKNGAKTKKFTVGKLKKKKTYYVKIRAFRKVKGVVYYGEWSNIKKVKTK